MDSRSRMGLCAGLEVFGFGTCRTTFRGKYLSVTSKCGCQPGVKPVGLRGFRSFRCVKVTVEEF